MANKKYADKLKDPRWQKRRLEILERDEWTCQYCDKKDETLNVHHKMYLKGKNPWDYEDGLLVTLCEDCHKDEHDMDDQFQAIEIEIKKRFHKKDFGKLAYAFSCLAIFPKYNNRYGTFFIEMFSRERLMGFLNSFLSEARSNSSRLESLEYQVECLKEIHSED